MKTFIKSIFATVLIFTLFKWYGIEQFSTWSWWHITSPLWVFGLTYIFAWVLIFVIQFLITLSGIVVAASLDTWNEHEGNKTDRNSQELSQKSIEEIMKDVNKKDMN